MVCHHDFHLILIIGLETTLVLRLRRSLEGNFHFLSGVLIGHLGTYFHLATCDSTVQYAHDAAAQFGNLSLDRKHTRTFQSKRFDN